MTMPKTSVDILFEEFSAGRGPVFKEDFYPVVTSLIRKMTPEQIRNFAYVSEGLENRIKSAKFFTNGISTLSFCEPSCIILIVHSLSYGHPIKVFVTLLW